MRDGLLSIFHVRATSVHQRHSFCYLALMNRPLGSSIALGLAVLLSGCADLARLVAPSGPDDSRPARVAFTASVATANTRSAADIVSLRVTTSYVLTGGRRDTIGTQTLVLTSAASQAVPIPVDLAGCLANANRDGASVDAGCSVVLELALRVNDAVVDRQTVGPLRLSPGATTEVSQPVMLFEIASVSLVPTGTLVLTLGGTANVTPTVKDSRGQLVAGRAVVWSSEAPTVATVDVSGKVTAVGIGEARIIATLGAVSGSLLVQVARPPVSLVISTAAGTGTGIVRSTPVGIDCRVAAGAVSGVCAFDFAADAQVTLTSTADAGQQFGAWGGACVGQAVGANCIVTMSQPRTASALFAALRRVTITGNATDGRGRVIGALGIDCRIDGAASSGTCTADLPDGSPLTLTSVPDAASNGSVAQLFAGWGGDCAGAAGVSCTITPTGGNRTANAGFFGGKRLDFSIDGSGGGGVTSVSGVACTRTGGTTSGTCTQTLMHGTSVTLFPLGDSQSDFAGWGGACAGQQLAMCTLTMSQPRTASALFAALRRVTITGNATDGRGRVIGALGIDCRIDGAASSGTCTADLPDGSPLTLTSVPDAASNGSVAQLFAGWGGDCAGAAGVSCTITPTGGNRTANAGFFGGKRLDFSIDGSGGGGVTSVSGVACTRTGGTTSGTCTQTLMHGTSVTLFPLGDSQSDFAGWGGACAGQQLAMCTLTLSQARSASATFVRRVIPLTLTLSGSGNGTVTANGIAVCARTSAQSGPVTCLRDFEPGTAVTVIATAGLQTEFEGNTGDCAGAAPCTLVMTAPRSVTSTFKGKGPMRLSIEALGASGSGVVRSAEVTPLIDCAIVNGMVSGGRCSTIVPAGTTVTLSAVGNPGFALVFWGAGCSGRTTHECTVVMDVPINVFAGFSPALDVQMQLSGSGLGSVSFHPTGAPSQAPCVLVAAGTPVACRFSLPTGTSGLFRGVPGVGARFDGFLGPCVESDGSTAVPLCTYRGIGFLRVFRGTFQTP